MTAFDRSTLVGATPEASLGDVDAASWERLRRGVELETGMDFSGSRLARLQSAVQRVAARNQQEATFRALLERPHEEGLLLEQLTAELTVGESYFFRNEHHFRALREQVMPQILAENDPRRELRVWSAGCATGEEPYSLAILLDQLLAGRGEWRVSILATDLNPEFLERARQGAFRAWSFRHTEVFRDTAYFAAADDVYHATARVRQHVRFAYLNLVKDVYPSPLTGTLGMDLILFRNVAIYLRPEVATAIVARFREALRPGGWLLLGETEVALIPAAGYEARSFDRATFYRREDRPDSPSPAAPFTASTTPFLNRGLNSSPPTAWPPNGSLLPLPKPLGPASPLPAPRPDGVVQTPTTATCERLERWVANHQFDDAERALARSRQRQERAQLRVHYVQLLLRNAWTGRARQMLDLALAEDPLLLEAHLLRASFAEDDGDWGTAEAAYRRALYVNRNCSMAHFHLALVQQQAGDRDGAARSLTNLLRLVAGQDPNAGVPYGEGVCYARLREMAEVLLTPHGAGEGQTPPCP